MSASLKVEFEKISHPSTTGLVWINLRGCCYTSFALNKTGRLTLVKALQNFDKPKKGKR